MISEWKNSGRTGNILRTSLNLVSKFVAAGTYKFSIQTDNSTIKQKKTNNMSVVNKIKDEVLAYHNCDESFWSLLKNVSETSHLFLNNENGSVNTSKDNSETYVENFSTTNFMLHATAYVSSPCAHSVSNTEQ